MLNNEFQEAKRVYSISESPEDKEEAIKSMRDILLARNNGEATYDFSYTEKGKTVCITDCGLEDLLAVDGDMNPIGL